MTEAHIHASLPPEHEWPAEIRALPRDHRGFPVLFFVAYVDGKPDIRVADVAKWRLCLRERRCWVCGGRLETRHPTFVIGPMCVVNRTTSEPPTHFRCAEFSARACPFLSRPKMVRNDAHLPAGWEHAGGVPLDRNPGATALYSTESWRVFDAGGGKPLIRLGEPHAVTWYTEGRRATREDMLKAFERGLPALREIADQEGADAVAELGQYIDRAMRLLPAA